MIFTTLILGLFRLILGIIGVVLIPVNNALTSMMPDVASGLTAGADFFELVGDSFEYVVSLTMLSTPALSLITLYFTFTIFFLPTFYFVKVIIKWFQKIKL